MFVCVISLSSVKTLVCSNYLCRLRPTVANYCTNSLQVSRAFANGSAARRSVCKYHATGLWVPSPGVREAADLPLGWTPPEKYKSVTDCSWHKLYSNLTGQTEPRLLGGRYHRASRVTGLVWSEDSRKRPHVGGRVMEGSHGWMSAYWEEWMNGGCQNVSGRFWKVCHSCRNVQQAWSMLGSRNKPVMAWCWCSSLASDTSGCCRLSSSHQVTKKTK